MLTTLQACQQLRADQVANGGTPDVPTLQRLIKRLPPTGQLAADLSTTANDTQASGDNSISISLDLAALAYDCRKVGVQIPD
jgi:hypothetical protein